MAERYLIGPVSNFGVPSGNSMALPTIMAQEYENMTFSSVDYYPMFGGCILADLTQALVDMLLSTVTVSPAASFVECIPPAINKKHVWHKSTVANQTGIITMPGLYANESYCVSLVSDPGLPEGQTAARTFTFAWGGYSVRWGDDIPRLYKGEVELGKIEIDDNTLSSFQTETHQRVYIRWVNGWLGITFSDVSNTLYYYVGNIPGGVGTFTGCAGSWAMNLTRIRYATSGTITTPFIQQYRDDFTAPTVRLEPSVAAYGTLAGALLQRDGTKYQYRYTLTGDGIHTPILMFAEPQYTGTISAVGTVAADITPWVEKASINIRRGLDASDGSITLRPKYTHDAQDLETFLGYPLQGTFACRIIDDEADDPTTPIWTGYINGDTWADQISCPTMTLALASKWWFLQNRRIMFGAMAGGLAPGTALAQAAHYAGMPDLLQDIVVTGDNYDIGTWDNPAFLPARGVMAAEWLEELVSARAYEATFATGGKLVIRDSIGDMPRVNDGINISYDQYDTITVNADRGNYANAVWVEGRASTGEPVTAFMQDTEALTDTTSPRYMPWPMIDYIQDDNLTTTASVTAKCLLDFERRQGGQRVLSLTANNKYGGNAIAQLRQYDRIYLIDPDRDDLAAVEWEVSAVSLEFGSNTGEVSATVELEEVLT